MKNNSSQAQYEKMTQTPIPRLVLSLGLPTTISMLVTNIYNMADTFFVSSLGTSASGATGIVFGLMAILQAFGFMYGHGAGSNISRQLGGRNLEEARRYSATSFWLAAISGTLIMIFGLLFQVPFMRLLGSTDSILPYAIKYSRFILIAAPAMTTSCVLNNVLRYEGKAVYAMIGLTSGGLLNILGDYILIFGFKMGITGAGISTAVSQYISVLILLMPYLTQKVQSRLNVRYISKNWKIIWNIISCGFPSMMRQGLNSISVMILNQCAAVYGDAAIAALSICSRVINFLFCVGLGVSQGFQPVSSFNYGAKKYSRVKKACLFTCSFNVAILSIAVILGFSFAEPIIRFFREDVDVIRIGAFALRAQCVSLVLIPVSMAGNMLFQSIGMSGRATFLASTRSGLFFIPILLFMSQFFGLTGITLSQGMADLLSGLVTIPFMLDFFRKLPEDVLESSSV